MVCLGNICRSPVADGLMKHHAQLAGINMEVDSCGTASYHIGEAPDTRSQANAKSHGVNISMLRARHFQKEDLQEFDYILCMDKNNLKDILAQTNDPVEKKKVRLFLEAAFPKTAIDVPDPYQGNESHFEHVFQLIDQGCKAWINEWKVL